MSLKGVLATGGIAFGVLGLALVGGAISGKLEHTPTAAPAPRTTSTSTSTSSSSTSSSTLPERSDETVVRAQLVEDMTLDVQSQRLDPDKSRRAALAASPSAVTARHNDIALAWVPEQVPGLQAEYDKIVHANASNPAAFSVTESEFVVKAWMGLTIDGVRATAILTGHYRLTEPTNHSVAGGIVDQGDKLWRITVRMTDGRWRLEDRSAS